MKKRDLLERIERLEKLHPEIYPFPVGAKVRVIGQQTLVPEKYFGQTGTVAPYESGNPPVRVDFDDGDCWYFDAENLEVVEEAAPAPEFNPGDRVRIVGNSKSAAPRTDKDTGTVTRQRPENSSIKVVVDGDTNDHDGTGWYYAPEDLELLFQETDEQQRIEEAGEVPWTPEAVEALAKETPIDCAYNDAPEGRRWNFPGPGLYHLTSEQAMFFLQGVKAGKEVWRQR